jgi:hypothetical protein
MKVKGFVANDVETEQIVHDANTTFFSYPPGKHGLNPSFTSFVQHRGSIPLYWSQEAAGMQAKPPIQLNVLDPYYTSGAKHFDQMMSRYSTPIIVLNLVKVRYFCVN